MSAGSFPQGLLLGDGRFRLERFLSAGATGEVYEAWSKEHGRAAVKLLHPDLARDAEWVSRFRREWSAARLINSPYVARVLAAGTSGRTRSPWIAFELIEGEPLEALLAREPQPPFAVITRLVEHLFLGLEAAHAAHVIHRDIKPGNLFIERSTARLRILDFGVAKVARIGAQTSGLTRLDHTLGTPDYMSPEHRRSPKDVDARSDLYSAGCVVFRMLTGKMPFEHRDQGMSRLMRESGAAPSLATTTRTTWPMEMQAWVDFVLASDRTSRAPTARAAFNAWAAASAAMATFTPQSVAHTGFEADTDVSPMSR
jgi:serine/threonine-protein kinase